MEDIIQSLDGEEHIEKAFGGPICSLETIQYSLQERPMPPIVLECPAPRCQKRFEDTALLVSHIRTTWDHGHRFHQRIVNAKYCIQCGKRFKDLTRHEHIGHHQPLTSRIDTFRRIGEGVPFTKKASHDGEGQLFPSATLRRPAISSTAPAAKRQKRKDVGNIAHGAPLLYMQPVSLDVPKPNPPHSDASCRTQRPIQPLSLPGPSEITEESVPEDCIADNPQAPTPSPINHDHGHTQPMRIDYGNGTIGLNSYLHDLFPESGLDSDLAYVDFNHGPPNPPGSFFNDFSTWDHSQFY
ncbi:hypothetical protein MauCBS54593_000240 [Microsporum audouinii]